jgi:hypothetical protein
MGETEMKSLSIYKVLTLVFLMVLALFFVKSSFAKLDMKNVAGMWLFDEGKGEMVTDSSGNGNDGAFVGKVKWVKGKYGSAVEFDGTSHINIPDSDTLDMNKEITVMFWINPGKVMKDMWAERMAVVGKHYLEYEVGIYMQGQLHTYTSNGAGDYDEGIMASIAGKLPDKDADWAVGKWYHVAWTLKKQHEIAYVNGVKIGEYDKGHEGTKPGTHPVNIGQRVEGGIPVTGAVDEVAILNVALDEATIAEVANKGLKAGGLAVVSSIGKLATTWAGIKK